MVWNFWYSSWLVYIVLERPVSTGKNSGLYFWCSLYIFWCTPGLCPWTYSFYPIYCSPQSRHRWAWCKTSSLCRWHKIYISLSGSEALESLTDLKSCVTDVFTWMTKSKLKLNPNKTEFIIIGSKKTKRKVQRSTPYIITWPWHTS